MDFAAFKMVAVITLKNNSSAESKRALILGDDHLSEDFKILNGVDIGHQGDVEFSVETLSGDKKDIDWLHNEMGTKHEDWNRMPEMDFYVRFTKGKISQRPFYFIGKKLFIDSIMEPIDAYGQMHPMFKIPYIYRQNSMLFIVEPNDEVSFHLFVNKKQPF